MECIIVPAMLELKQKSINNVIETKMNHYDMYILQDTYLNTEFKRNYLKIPPRMKNIGPIK